MKFLNMPLDAQVRVFLLDINLGMELLGHRVGIYSVSIGNAHCYPEWLCQCMYPCVWAPPSLHPRLKLWPHWLLRNVLVCVSSRNADLISKCGDDARIYITFQYHLIVFVIIICIPSLGIILPINYSGNVLGRQSSAAAGPRPLDLRVILADGIELGPGSLEIYILILLLIISYVTQQSVLQFSHLETGDTTSFVTSFT